MTTSAVEKRNASGDPVKLATFPRQWYLARLRASPYSFLDHAGLRTIVRWNLDQLREIRKAARCSSN